MRSCVRYMNQDLYLCFIDYSKDFDKVRHDQLLKLLKEKNLDSRNINIISNLFFFLLSRRAERLHPIILSRKAQHRPVVEGDDLLLFHSSDVL